MLSHKEMRHSGINVIMMFIAVSDFGCAVTGLMQLFIRNYSDQYMLFITAYLQLFVDYLAVVFHASSLFLAAGMALCRVMALNFSNRLKDKWQSPRYALRVTCAVYITVLTVSTLIVPVNEVKKTDDGEVYIDTSDFSLAYGCLLMKIVLVFVGICFKLIPCTLMLILSILLLQKMDEGKRSSVPINRNHKKDQLDRSSQLIQTILIVFLITEVPQGVFSIIGGIEVIDYLNYYQNLTIFMNVLSFFNTTTSFIIYSSLSAKFRRIFAQTFLPKNLLNMYMVTVAHFSKINF
ncbi:G-protein coupled receptors family 1 profile domain-containing protein [Caenorhabditis elegans]|uniref:G-protein coupled receptors family 1 profile domain-containing protein n=1 Tax=Caenorhabditis elegans TaxID=6239 RepID=A0A131MBW3_CAEEL|nr:G-protein coupled receptors family 1 profile domain-containing protein [Caenorhabditis elegans]CZR14574.1 G-protein coupled receptors family 1 profile domain-containing protein [Caenorhabditis elegans]|eukprot:NP_001309649.1 DroMyoSuppressin Receptor related [Caenorhabditis elegans]